MVKAKPKGSKPWWWKPLWISILLSTIALGVMNYFLFHIPLERVAGASALTFLMIGFAYYIRIRPSRRVNRVLYICLGACITFLAVLFGNASVFLVTGSPPIPTYLGPWLSFIVVMIASPIAGAFIGDRIGKRRNYRLPLSLGNEVRLMVEKKTLEMLLIMLGPTGLVILFIILEMVEPSYHIRVAFWLFFSVLSLYLINLLFQAQAEVANKIGDLKKAITYLQNESIDIRVRINSVLRDGRYHVRGMGKNLATAILHVCDKEDKYGVWNNRNGGDCKT